MSISELGHSQVTQPIQTKEGLLISYPLMDSITVKLINRAYLQKQITTKDSINKELNGIVKLRANQVNYMRDIFINQEQQKNDLEAIIINLKTTNTNNKRKWLKRTVYGCGISFGLGAFLVLLK